MKQLYSASVINYKVEPRDPFLPLFFVLHDEITRHAKYVRIMQFLRLAAFPSQAS